MKNPSSDPEHQIAERVSGVVSRLYLDKFGKGPLHIETFLNGDVVTTLLRDVFTPAEEAMVADGRHDSVISTRTHWQSATDELFRSGVAEATGREVVAAISGFHPERGMASEVFVLAPE